MNLNATSSASAIATATVPPTTILFCKDKGGVGGSTAATATAELLRAAGGDAWTTAVLDADSETQTTTSRLAERHANGDFLAEQSVAHGVISFDLGKPNEAGLIIDCAEFVDAFIVADTPAGSLARFRHLNENLDGSDLVAAHRAHGRKVVVAVPITPMLASIANVATAIERFGRDVDYIVVRNMVGSRDADPFILWNEVDFKNAYGEIVSGNSKARLSEVGGHVIDLPALDPGIYAKIDALGLSFMTARSHARLALSERQSVTNWLRKWAKELDKVRHVTGCPVSLAASLVANTGRPS